MVYYRFLFLFVTLTVWFACMDVTSVGGDVLRGGMITTLQPFSVVQCLLIQLGVLKTWNVSIPWLSTKDQKSRESEFVPAFFCCSILFLYHLTSVEALVLAVRLSASEARKDRALILELMLGWGPWGPRGEQCNSRSKFLRKLCPTKPYTIGLTQLLK